MKSVAIFAGLVGLASATGWGNHTTTTTTAVKSTSKSSSTWLHPTAPISSSSWVHPTVPSSSWDKPNSTTTEELTTYTTTTICPVTETHGTTTLTKLTTSVITVTSCKGGCTKSIPPPLPTAELWVKPNTTTTEDITVYTTTTVCPVTETHGATTITKLTTSLITVTSCKGGCKPTSAPAPWVPSGKPSKSTESKVWGNATSVISKQATTVTLYSTNKVTVTSCGPHGCPVTTLTSSVPTGVKVITEQPSTVTEKTTILTTTCPVTTTYVSQGTTHTSVYTTVSTYSTVATAPAPSAPAPSAPAPSAPAPSAPAPSAPAPSAPAPSAPAPSAPAPSAPATTPAASATQSSTGVASTTTAAQPSVSVFLGAGSINNAPVAVVGALMALAAFF